VITTIAELRRAFWDDHPNLSRRRIRAYSGRGLMYPTDTRVAFVDWIDAMQRDGRISNELAQRATISRND
jgi:hypothetical protein